MLCELLEGSSLRLYDPKCDADLSVKSFAKDPAFVLVERNLKKILMLKRNNQRFIFFLSGKRKCFTH